MASERIVSVGLLTEGDLIRLGPGFNRHFPVPDDDIFADLLTRLDEVKASPHDDGITLKVPKSSR
jgi:hypothetical protein